MPRRITYDNSRIAVSRILGPRQRELTREFLRLQSHFLFAAHFCRVRQAHEKGQVECLVGYARRNFLVPVPSVNRLEDLNVELEQRCRQDLDRRLRGQSATKAVRLEEERPALLEVPRHGFEARRVEPGQADSLSLVRFDGNSYSVPTACAHQPVTVVGGIDQVKIVCRDRVVAEHPRCWDRDWTCWCWMNWAMCRPANWGPNCSST